ncbi:hypothetical protein EMIHUDRAFT_45138, partial [Emiliania huxleyi CCMP1516]|uniref:AAA+ ATPase domain-containing protein n=2 Tax=Emiliania huxleyi TaxID=2903 RepID=A0A0D3I505_EMIH1
KTMLVRALAAESRLNLLAVPIPQLIRPAVGASERALAALFEHARAHRPCLVFLDELQAASALLLPALSALLRRGGGGGGGGGQVSRLLLSQLLLEMDAVQAEADADAAAGGLGGAVVLAGATNTPAALDEALLRPGRLEHLFFVPPPGRRARRDILARQLRRMPLAEPIDAESLAAATPRFTGADLLSLCQKAALGALRR